MTYSIQFWGDQILFNGSQIAMDPRCCCNPVNTDCCCLSQYSDVTPPIDLTATITGVVGGSGTLSVVSGEITDCVTYEGVVTMNTGYTCGGEVNTITLRLTCPDGSTDPNDIRLTITGGGAACNVVLKNGGIPEAGTTCDPLILIFKLETDELMPGGCPCGDAQEITVTITL